MTGAAPTQTPPPEGAFVFSGVRGGLALGELRRLAGPLEAGLLALLHAGVAREQVFRLVTQPPQRLSMDVLAALCDILDCTPSDLIEIAVVNAPIKKAVGDAAAPAPPAVRRTTVRRPDHTR